MRSMDQTRTFDPKGHGPLTDLVARLSRDLGDKLRAVLLYGPAARGEAIDGAELHLLVLLADLQLPTLAAAGPALEKWVSGRQPMPRLFTPATLAAAADVFPIELGDIAERHIVVHGAPSFAVPAIDTEHLRLQCERELREKVMRLEEAYALAHGREADIKRLLLGSYPTFIAVFRGCLRLHGDPVPEPSADVAAAFCRLAGLDAAPFREIDRMRRGLSSQSRIVDLFTAYHGALVRGVSAVDRFRPQRRTATS
jgi:hypothetical protein